MYIYIYIYVCIYIPNLSSGNYTSVDLNNASQ